MRLRTALTVVAALALAAVSVAQTQATLVVGDPAPNITVGKWVKGTPVAKFEKGKLYVVEFWATWCGPCKVSIPHLTELAKKFAGKVSFVGVSAFETDQKQVAPFVDSMGKKMSYNVAMDQLPTPDSKGTDGAMAKTWMEAASQQSIPTAFIIDRDSKIAWIGHPMNLEEPLTKVVNGTYGPDDYAKAKADQLKAIQDTQAQMAGTAKLRDYGKRLDAALKANDNTAAMAVLDEMMADSDPNIQVAGGMTKFQMLLKNKDYDGASKLGNTLVTGILKDNADALNNLAWFIADPAAKLDKRDLDLAMAAAQRSVDVSKDYANLDTLARVYFEKGDKAKAIDLEKQAIAIAPEDQKKSLQDALKEYGG